MKRVLALAMLIAVMTVVGCSFNLGIGDGLAGSGVEKKEKRDLAAFTQINLECLATLNITCQQDKANLEITGDDNIVPLIITEINDNTLTIKASQSYKPKTKLEININVPNIEKLSLSGAGQVDISKVKNESLAVDVSGAALFKANGETKALKITLSGAGSLDAKDLHAEKAVVNVSGAGTANLFATEQLDANVSGAGSINYYGNPKTVNKSVSGVGSVNAKQGV